MKDVPVPKSVVVAIAVGYVLLAVYSFVIGQLILGFVFPAVIILVGFAVFYLLWLFISEVKRIADALERIADQRERSE